MKLRQIENFGGIDADEDGLLRACFQDHPAYIAAKEHRRWLVIGRKRSGKTAIFNDPSNDCATVRVKIVGKRH